MPKFQKEPEPELTCVDYLTRPYEELRNHPDFSMHALRIASAISRMTSKQLEQIDIIGGKTRG